MRGVDASQPALRALRRPAVLVPLLVTLGAALWMHAAPADELARTLPTEDAYYALSVARQAALGNGITADGIHETNGFQPLWVALNVPLYALAGGDRITGLRLSQLLSTGLWLAFVVLLALQARALVRRHGGEGATAAAAAAIVAAGSVSIFRLFHNGLETGVVLVALAAAVLVLDRWERWTARRVVLAGLLLGAAAWARLDAVAFAIAFAAVAVVRAWRAHDLRQAIPTLAACALAALVLSPWLAYNVSLDGSPMPSSGKAEGAHVDVGHNIDSGLRAVSAWAAPPLLRPSMHFTDVPVSEVLAVIAIALTLLAVRYVRRRRREPLGHGTVALALFTAFLVGWYVFNFGPWWFMERYLAPVLLLTVPFVASALELSRPRPRALAWVAGVVLVANVPLLAVLASGPTWPPPAWSARDSNLGTHTNLNYEDQLAWVREHVSPDCVVGAYETGTLLYFRDRTVNLDGKVDHEALEARMAGRAPDYVDERGVDVMVDIRSGIDRGLRGRRDRWRLVEMQWRYEAWVRTRREAACLRG
jgi:hypothetical protein